MAYTIGASHGPFTGQGNFVISKPVGIRTVLTGIPFYTGHDGGDPRRYFKLGRFTMGNSHGFQFSHGLEYAQQLLYPMPPVWELLAYDVKDGASCLFEELVDVPDLSLKQPWDRTPLPVSVGTHGSTTPGGTVITPFTYTVPVGRRMYVSKITLKIRRWVIATTLSYVQSYILINGAPFAQALFMNNVVGSETGDEGHGGGLILNPGNTVSATIQDSSTGGQCYFTTLVSGTLFDA